MQFSATQTVWGPDARLGWVTLGLSHAFVTMHLSVSADPPVLVAVTIAAPVCWMLLFASLYA